MELKIEKGIPLAVRGKFGVTATCAKMEVGDSFYIDFKVKQASASLSNARRKGMKFTCRSEGEGTRVWRVA